MKKIITIGRELGSGGRTIGKLVAAELGIKYYDRELIDEVAKKSGLSADFIEKNDQTMNGSFLYNLVVGNSYAYGSVGTSQNLPLNMQVFLAQTEAINEFSKEPCVIVGRCADYILRERDDVLRCFIFAEYEDRLERAKSHNPDFNDKKARDLIYKSDRGRDKHYATFTDWEWGDRAHYDLMLNSSTLGFDGAVRIITDAYKTGK